MTWRLWRRKKPEYMVVFCKYARVYFVPPNELGMWTRTPFYISHRLMTQEEVKEYK